MFTEYQLACDIDGIAPLSWSTFMKEKPWEVGKDQGRECCVCVYHYGAALMVKALNLARSRAHTPHCDEGKSNMLCRAEAEMRQSTDTCCHAASCSCKCGVCANKTSSLTQFMDTVLCPRVESRFYQLKCVKGKCGECGWDKIQGACEIDTARTEKDVFVKILTDVASDYAGTSKKSKQATNIETTMEDLLSKAKTLFCNFGEHDFIARWQASQYRSQINTLRKGHHLLVMDFIENAKIESKIEMQQDYYTKQSIAIFMVLVIRWRREGETMSDNQVRLSVSTLI